MKKRIGMILVLAAAMVLLAACMTAAQADSLPAEIKDQVNAKNVTITDNDRWEGTWFVLASSAKGDNILYCFTQKDGKWKESFHTSKAVPQGKNRVDIYTVESALDWTTDRTIKGPLLVIAQMDEGDEYIELFTAYRRASAAKWNLARIWSHTSYGNMLIEEGKITYYRGLEDSRVAGSVQGTIQRDLRYVSLGSLPRTLKQAQSKITTAPTMPRDSELQAVEIQFTGGKKYEVYSGPGKNYLRGGNGKAAVSTNGWIQVFGQDNGWILIQYSIDTNHYRFGYIPASALPKKTYVENLAFSRAEVTTANSVNVTDDPLYSQATLKTLSAGEKVEWLATVGQWAYIEGNGFRGFVPVSDLAYTDADDRNFTVHTGNDGKKYDLFEIQKFIYEGGKVAAVTGQFERVGMDDDCYAPEYADNGTLYTYYLADGFSAEMMDPVSDDPLDPYIPVTDLHAWYIDAYMAGEAPANGELTFQCDLPADEAEAEGADFWFVTTRILLNQNSEIEYMEYFYVPWA